MCIAGGGGHVDLQSTSRDPLKPFCSRESWLSGLVSKAKCFFRPRYKDNLSQLPFSHALPFIFSGLCSKAAEQCRVK